MHTPDSPLPCVCVCVCVCVCACVLNVPWRTQPHRTWMAVRRRPNSFAVVEDRLECRPTAGLCVTSGLKEERRHAHAEIHRETHALTHTHTHRHSQGEKICNLGLSPWDRQRALQTWRSDSVSVLKSPTYPSSSFRWTGLTASDTQDE